METQVNPAYLKYFPQVLQLVKMIRQCKLQGVQQMVAVTLQTITYFRQTIPTYHSTRILSLLHDNGSHSK